MKFEMLKEIAKNIFDIFLKSPNSYLKNLSHNIYNKIKFKSKNMLELNKATQSNQNWVGVLMRCEFDGIHPSLAFQFHSFNVVQFFSSPILFLLFSLQTVFPLQHPIKPLMRKTFDGQNNLFQLSDSDCLH